MNIASLTLKGLTKDYSTRVVDSVDLDFRAGEIHALLGANGAGKSTLCRMMAGLVSPSSGGMIWQGQSYRPPNKQTAEKLGVQMVQQELTLIPTLDVAHNLFFSRLPNRYGWINSRQLYRNARGLLSEFGLDEIDPYKLVGALGVGQQQMIEIVANLSKDCRLLILDEPTAALTARETTLLFKHLDLAKANGVAIVYISHRLDEVSAISDRVTVLRDGCKVGTWDASDLDHDAMVSLMTHGVKTSPNLPSDAVTTDKTTTPAELHAAKPILRVEGLRREPKVHSVSFSVRAGEVYGIAGLVGSGRTELLRLIFGADRADAGNVILGADAPRKPFANPSQAVDHGVVMISEDRKNDGLLMEQSIVSNIVLAGANRWLKRSYCQPVRNRWGYVSNRNSTTAANHFRRILDIRCKGVAQDVNTLSGGNQQKVVLAKWMHRDGNIFLLDEPTRGIDAAARMQIYQAIRSLCSEGKAVLLVSSDLEELLQVSDRIGVMSNGHWVAEFDGPQFSREQIMESMFSGYSTTNAGAEV